MLKSLMSVFVAVAMLFMMSSSVKAQCIASITFTGVTNGCTPCAGGVVSIWVNGAYAGTKTLDQNGTVSCYGTVGDTVKVIMNWIDSNNVRWESRSEEYTLTAITDIDQVLYKK